jgi:polyisoprenoid-binding protein YceI
VLWSTGLAQTKTFKTIPNDKKNVVQFISEATLETIVGKTASVNGQLDLNLDDLTSATKGSFEVDLTTIDTGIEMRNGHMRDQYLDTKSYPKAQFTLNKVISSGKKTLSDGETVHMMAEGEFVIHGVSKLYQIPVTLTYAKTNAEAAQRIYGSKGDLLVVKAEWTVKLADHKITRPQFMLMRLSEEQKASVSFVMTDILPER